MSTLVPEVFWWPDPQHAAASRIAEFTRYVRDRRGVSIPDGDYAALHAWSVRDLAGFWSAVAEFVGVRFHQAPTAVLGAERMPGTEWFPGATLNYAEHVLRPSPGRGDGDTLNRGGVRMGTADFYAVVEGFDQVADSLVIDTTELGADQGQLLCFLVLAPGITLTDIEPQLRRTLRSELSPRHVPDRFIVIDEVPRTLSGKKLEVPVKKILAGVPANQAVSKDALQNPEALTPFLEMAAK